MKVLSAQPTTFDELKFPDILYKYREAENSIHRTIITQQIVYFAPPKSFEDEFDCKNPYRYDLLSDTEIFDNYVKTLKELNPQWDEFYVRQKATILSNQGLLRDKKRLEALEKDDYERLNEIFGVLSLTANNSSVDMWKKYASDFNGFCVGFIPRMMFKNLNGGGGQVAYEKMLPMINPLESDDAKFTKLIFCKEDKWTFEEEYRTVKMWGHAASNDDRKISLHSSIFKEVIVGHNTSSNVQKDIIKQAKIVNPKIEIKITTFDKNVVSIQPYF